MGVIFSLLAGLMITLQSIFNARLGEKLSFWHTNAFVHGSGLIVAFIILLFNEKLNFTPIKAVNPHYLLGGAMGVVIIFSVMKGITDLGASYAVTILIVTQIIATAVINYFGVFGEPIIVFTGIKVFGLLLIVSGLLVYQLA
ncbi:protein of unknown function DUF606 [Alkaliphilus metalliredigens QYMF]|uniref:DMT family transporter n=1 Tax=Alkaliphilus metalliredigens (strain QYMF) TaxID=293826 RepID=A6TST2_ALKMQ|nr:DMT family transporter [Alkaliphilus metalliredigens]ABR49250.1 protein of unknown function DUF606 [Alkaliphilus metalliredigens QYMF]